MSDNNPLPHIAGNVLTVIIRDDSPVMMSDDCPTFRSVQIDLTKDQIKALELCQTARIGMQLIFESVSRCFLEIR